MTLNEPEGHFSC